jgi:hypothetical protein
MKIYQEVKDVPAVSGIYALLCPDTKEVRYIGKSKNIKKRFKAHRGAARTENYPVSMWVVKMREAGKKPFIRILEEVGAKEINGSEIRFIAYFREEGARLLNIHGGGAIPASIGNGRSSECWSVNNIEDPWRVLRNMTLGMAKNNSNVKSIMKSLSEDYRSLSSERERVDFQLNCFVKVLNIGGNKSIDKVEAWIVESAKQINKSYPKRVTIRYSDGVEVTP